MSAASWRRGDVLLGLYEVVDVLDSGGMGLLHRVRHRGWNMDLAVKVPRPDLVATAEGRRRFEVEAGTWVGLGAHPNVVNCVYVRRVEGSPCVFAEWIAGGSLAELVRDGRRREDHDGGRDAGDRSLARVLDIAVQIAWGIDHAHRRGLIHQDIKPANVMVDVDADAGADPGWTAKVTDFGLAGARAAAGESAVVPREGSLLASYGGMTPAYCSPEQADARAGARVALTRATDVWSWALCVLEMLVGHPPCEHGQAAPEVFGELLESGQMGTGGQAMPPALTELLWRCFDVDPATRPHRLDELATTVTEIYADVVGAPYPRLAPQGVDLLADGLSNQALSLLDLDRADESEELWRRAMDVDPHHPSTVYNWSLYRWRQGVLTDEEVVSALRTVGTIGTSQGERGRADHLLGLVHVERGDDDAAREPLADAPGTHELDAARVELSRRRRSPRPERLSGHAGAVTAIAVDATGEVAISGGRDGRIRVWAAAENRCRCELPEASAATEPGRAGQDDGTAEGDDVAAAVTAVAITGDGRTALSARGKGPIELWDLVSGTRRRMLDGHTSSVTAVALNGSDAAAVAYHSGLVEVWELATGRVLQTFDHPPTPFQELDRSTGRLLPEIHHRPPTVTAVALGDDGDVVVSAAPLDGSVVVWDVAGGRALHQLVTSADLHRTGIDQVALSPDGTYALLAGRQMSTVHVWETRTDRIRDTVRNQMDPYAAVALNDDATVAVSAEGIGGGRSQPLRVWEMRSGRCLRTVDTRLEPMSFLNQTCVALSGDGQVVVVGDQHGGVQVHHQPRAGFRAAWSYARPRSATALERGEAAVRRLVERAEELAGRGMTAAAAGELRAARAVPGFERHPGLRPLWAELGRKAGRRTDLLGIWKRYTLRGGTWTFTPEVSLALSVDGELAVTGGADGLVRVWELQTGQCVHVFAERVANTHTILIAEDGSLAVTADWGGTAHLWDLEDGTRRCQLYGDHGQVKALSMDRHGWHALVGDDDGALCLWDLRHLRGQRQARRARTMVAHDGPVGSVQLSNDGEHAASAGRDDRTGKLWQTATGRPMHSFPLDFGPVALRFSPDGRRLFANTMGQLTAWDVPTCRRLYERDTYTHETLAISADGRIGVTHGLGTVQVWEAETGRTVCELPERAHTFDVSPDGWYVVTGYDRVLRMWDVRTGQCVHTLEGHTGHLSMVVFSADGRNLVSADRQHTIRLWELDWDYVFGAPADQQ